MHEVINLLEEGADISNVDITLFPPDEGGNITDEDSGDEENDMNHLPGRMLRQEVEVNIVGENIGSNFEDNNHLVGEQLEDNVGQQSLKINACEPSSSSFSSPQPSTSSISPPKKKRARTTLYKKGKKDKGKVLGWLDNEAVFVKRAGKGDTTAHILAHDASEMSKVECFEKMFSQDVVDLLVNMSNTYALQQNKTLNVTQEEIKIFVSILLMTGYSTPRNVRMYWEVQSDTHNSAASASMRRNRFLEIQQFLHLSDNTHLPQNDRFAKVRLYFTMLSKNFEKNFEHVFTSHLSIDETMVPYYGRHGAKQHLKGKPIRFGYKIWSMATRDGYLISFEPYQGAAAAPLPDQAELGLGAAVVTELSSRLPSEKGPYNLYVDSFFVGIPLIRLMTEHNVGITGTIKDNRMEKCPVMPFADMKKKKRGSSSSMFVEDMCVVRWNDNSIVTVASNCHGTVPIHKVDRIGFVAKKKTKIIVDCPNIVKQYNCFMGGVDRFDQNIGSLRVNLKGKKWWYPLFLFGIDAACQNAWQLYKATSRDSITYCDFRRAVVQHYIFTFGNPSKKKHAVTSVPKKKKNVGGGTSEHTRVACSQRRCRQCHKKTKFMCEKCGVGLHIHCWYDHHLSV